MFTHSTVIFHTHPHKQCLLFCKTLTLTRVAVVPCTKWNSLSKRGSCRESWSPTPWYDIIFEKKSPYLQPVGKQLLLENLFPGIFWFLVSKQYFYWFHYYISQLVQDYTIPKMIARHISDSFDRIFWPETDLTLFLFGNVTLCLCCSVSAVTHDTLNREKYCQSERRSCGKAKILPQIPTDFTETSLFRELSKKNKIRFQKHVQHKDMGFRRNSIGKNGRKSLCFHTSIPYFWE